MNKNRDLLKRLLRLYPARLVKDFFEEDGNVIDAIEAITLNQTEQDILTFTRENQIFTKQHIFIFSIDNNFNPNFLNGFPFEIIDSRIIDGEQHLFCLPMITYRITLYNPLEEEELFFLQPIIVTFHNDKLIVRITKVEKTVSHYYANDRGAIRQGQTQNESENLNSIINHLSQFTVITPLDINAGVKHLWNINLIDSKKVQWRNDASVDTVTMDENLTFKTIYPNKYLELINDPLVKTMFKYLPEDDYLCDTFDVDPTNGIINIPKFPQNVNQVTNVITHILANN